MNRVIELNELIKNPDTDRKLGMLQMTEMVLSKTYSKTYQRSNWLRRPLSDKQIYWAALDAVLPLQIFIAHFLEYPSCKVNFYTYCTPEVLPKVVPMPSNVPKSTKVRKTNFKSKQSKHSKKS